MKKVMIFLSIVSVLTLSGCAGLSQKDKAEAVALKNYQKAGAKVDRKSVKLGLATAASAVALQNVAKSTKELEAAKKEQEKAKEALKEELGLSS